MSRTPTESASLAEKYELIYLRQEINQPRGLAVDEDDGTVYVADYGNHRIVANTPGSNDTNGRVVASGNGQGNGLNQLNGPVDILIDKKTHSLIICERWNNRIVRWSMEKGTKQGEIIIDNIQDCWGVAMGDEGALYVSSLETNDVRRFTQANQIGTVVAGRGGKGTGLNQLNDPCFIAVDGENALYVSDCWNHRVIKWSRAATRGTVVAGHHHEEEQLEKLSYPRGVLVDSNGTVYVAEQGNNQRVTRWQRGATEGELIVGGKGPESEMNQIRDPAGITFDRHGHLFVADSGNHRVQRFSIAQKEKSGRTHE